MGRSILAILSFLLVCCSAQTSVVFTDPVLPPVGGTPNIFKEYSKTNDSVMMTGWSRNFDMSGVSFDQKTTATLVTRKHVVMAKHYPRKAGSKVIFHDRNGVRLERTIVKTAGVYGDVAVGLLDSDVPAGYRVYALPTTRDDFKNLVGKTAVVTDQNRRIFFHEINGITEHAVSFKHSQPALHGVAKKLISGDSGNPSFLISGKVLVLIETHTYGGAGSGPFYGSPIIQEKLQALITGMSPGYRLTYKAL